MFSMYRAVPLCRRAVPLCRRAVPLCRRAVPLCRSRWQTLPCTRSWPLSYRTTPPRWTGSRSSVTTGSWWSNTPTSGTTSPTDRTMSCNVWGSVDTLMGVAHCLQGNKSVRTGFVLNSHKENRVYYISLSKELKMWTHCRVVIMKGELIICEEIYIKQMLRVLRIRKFRVPTYLRPFVGTLP